MTFQNPRFCAGYISYRIKLNDDPIPPYILPATQEYNDWMAGWNTARQEVQALATIKDKGNYYDNAD